MFRLPGRGGISDGVALLVLVPVGFAAGGGLYFLPLVHWWGTTVGKRIFGLRVVRLWSDGTLPPSWKDTFLREFHRAAFLSIPVLNLLVGAMPRSRPVRGGTGPTAGDGGEGVGDGAAAAGARCQPHR
ncbi:RDD family protein [Streptomyces sp. NPDC001858]